MSSYRRDFYDHAFNTFLFRKYKFRDYESLHKYVKEYIYSEGKNKLVEFMRDKIELSDLWNFIEYVKFVNF